MGKLLCAFKSSPFKYSIFFKKILCYLAGNVVKLRAVPHRRSLMSKEIPPGGRILNLQKVLSFVRRAVDDYHMIEKGDHIAVGISGGKDSLTLLLLSILVTMK